MSAALKRREICQKKFSFKTYSHAAKAMRELLERQYRGGEMEIYSCGWCDGYHVGHKPQQHIYAQMQRKMGLNVRS